MLLGILSDTHDQVIRTRHAVELLRDAGAEALVHCGDLTGPEIVETISQLPAWFVFGNHDADRVPELLRAAAEYGPDCLEWGGVIELAGQLVAVTHGHLATDVRRVLAQRPDYLLSGHSHAASDRIEGTVRRINPGALHRAEEYSVALLDLTSGELRFIKVDD